MTPEEIELAMSIARKLKGEIRRFRINVLQLKAGAYCNGCGKYYTFRERDSLKKERFHPKHIATHTIYECESKSWRYIG